MAQTFHHQTICLVVALICTLRSFAIADDPVIAEFRGQTMGTTYSVKVVDPPPNVDSIRIGVDSELRRVNSEMSTYLESSEISRFNKSRSTDWFDVSPGFAEVVAMALDVSQRTGGAFDVTISPYIDLWNFGAAARSMNVPRDEDLATAASAVGYEKLAVRHQPPAIRKSVSELTIDLSAIAKGHGVDRVVQYLQANQCDNVFVEIGGEVRVLGDKHGQPWRVGIQVPDAAANEVMVAHALTSTQPAMATSGDYRNFFESDDKRYSHTIDPRTRHPVTHPLASVSVSADDCMTADAWATAITVLGPVDGIAIGKQNQIDALLIDRQGTEFTRTGIGTMQMYSLTPAAGVIAAADGGSSLVPMFVVTAIVLAIIITAMAIGVIFGRHAISGSCGGIAGTENEDGSVSCSLCSNPADACKDLRERMRQQEQSRSVGS